MVLPPAGKNHRGVIFPKRPSVKSSSVPSSASSRAGASTGDSGTNRLRQTPRITASSPATQQAVCVPRPAFANMIPDLFTNLPVLRDLLRTDTSEKQDGTIQECLPYLKNIEPSFAYNDRGVPHLDRKRHAEFLRKSLNTLPAAYVGADASRPWFLYWALNGLATLGEDVSEFRERVVSTTRPIQNASGGFGGSNGQTSHLAPTYAVVLSLAIVGGEEALDLIDRRSTWKWLGSLKTPNGGFQMAVGGEVDIR